GARGDDGTGSFLGSIDELGIYDEPLSPAQIQAIAALGTSGKQSATGVRFVARPRLLPSRSLVSATEGAATEPVTVATFHDEEIGTKGSDYTATVSWGGTETAGTILPQGDGNYLVQGAKPSAYAEEGTYAVTVTITDGPTN